MSLTDGNKYELRDDWGASIIAEVYYNKEEEEERIMLYFDNNNPDLLKWVEENDAGVDVSMEDFSSFMLMIQGLGDL